MRSPVSRREFLKQAGLVAGALPVLGMQAEAVQAKDKLRCVVIGCGGRGQSHLDRAVKEKNATSVQAFDHGSSGVLGPEAQERGVSGLRGHPIDPLIMPLHE